MENEEAVLKKQLDEAKDFETRREIRQKLRELRKKRISALESEVVSNERRSRRQQPKAEEVIPVENKVNSTEEESEKSVKKVQNGEIEEEKGSEEPVERSINEEGQGENGNEPVPEVTSGDTEQGKDEEEKEENEEKAEEPADDVEPSPPHKPPRPADGKITEEYVEQLEDVDDLEELLKEVPLSEFNIRKKIRNVIRERKKQKVLENTARSRVGSSNVSGQYSRSLREKITTRDISGGKEETTTKQRTFGKSNIDDMFEKRRKERMMAKRKEAAEKKQGRAAFKAKLEAQNPKPASGGGRHFQTGNKITRAMIEWCRRKTYGYEGVDIQNFSTSWTNGLAMCALLHRFVPDKIDYESLDPKDRRANWKLAFDVAGECGIEPLLELEDIMACSVPEPKSLMTYVHFIYQFFCEAPKEKPPPPSWDDDDDDDE